MNDLNEEVDSYKSNPKITYYYETFELDTYFTQNKIKIPQVNKVSNEYFQIKV